MPTITNGHLQETTESASGARRMSGHQALAKWKKEEQAELDRIKEIREAQHKALFSSAEDGETAEEYLNRTQDSRTDDSFQNFMLNLGIGTDNALSGSTYGYNPISRNRILLEFMHRGSWLAGQAIDIPGDDMTREGIEIISEIDQDERDRFHSAEVSLQIWPAINDGVRWSRLYGGAIVVILVDGQDSSTPLKIDTVGRNQFKGLLVLDRWMVEPSLGDLIGGKPNELGPQMGLPRYYRVSTFSPGLRGKKIHYSRCMRLEGVRLPYSQRMMENLWGLSVLERLNDRMIAFDSATMGAAQLVYKSYIRTYRIKDLRKHIGGNTQIFQQIVQYVEMMRKFQGIEGVTLMDLEDEFVPMQSTAFTGISDALAQFGQQLAGALQIPLVRLFGMSPAGFSSTGESDLRTYYDHIAQRQDRDLRTPLDRIYRVMARSEGIDLGDDFQFAFRPLWKLPEEARAGVAGQVTSTVTQAYEQGIINKRSTALQELKRSSRITGVWSNITDDDIKEAEQEPPHVPGEMGGAPMIPGMEGMGEGEQGTPPEMAEISMPGGSSPLAGMNASPGLSQPGSGEAPQQQEDSDKHFTVTPDGHVHLHLVRDSQGIVPGLEIIIETPQGTTRFPFRTQLPAHYGHIRGTLGADQEEVDCFVGPEPDKGHDVFIIDQVNPHNGSYDEAKVMLGWPNRALALRAYQKAFDDGLGAARIGAVTKMTMRDLSNWLNAGGGTKPIGRAA